MLTVETVIVAIWIASMAAVVGGAAGVMHQLAQASAQPAEYAGHHHKPVPSLRIRVAAALLDGWREMAAAHALMTGAAAPHPTVLIGG